MINLRQTPTFSNNALNTPTPLINDLRSQQGSVSHEIDGTQKNYIGI